MPTYYVSMTGNDNDSGGILTPWRNRPRAFSTVASPSVLPGDTVIFRDGTYPSVAEEFVGRSGALGAPITLKAQPGETVIWPLAAGGLNISLANESGPISDYTIDGIEWTGDFIGNHGRLRPPLIRLIVKNFYAHTAGNPSSPDNFQLLYLDVCEDCQVLNGTLRDVVGQSGSNNAAGIKSYKGKRLLVDGVLFDNCTGGGITQKEGADDTTAQAMEVRFSRFKSCNQGGVVFAPSQTLPPIQNAHLHHLFFDQATDAVIVTANGTSIQQSGLKVNNCTKIATAGGFFMVIRGMTLMEVYDNIVYAADLDGRAIETATPDGQALMDTGFSYLDYNWYYGMASPTQSPGGAWVRDHNQISPVNNNAYYATLAEWRASASTSPPTPGTIFPANKEANSRHGQDPQFLDTVDYALAETSPARTAGRFGGYVGWKDFAAPPPSYLTRRMRGVRR